MIRLQFSISALFIFMMASLGLVSCDKDSLVESTTADVISQNFVLEDDFSGRHAHGDRGNCFTLEFPVSVTFVDGSTLTFDDKESMRDSLRAYHRANPDADRPGLVFPVVAILQDGTTQTLSSDEELKALREACRPSGIRGRKGDQKDREEACFTLEFPVSVTFVDGSTLTFDDKESMRDSLRAYHRANPDADRPELVFPVVAILQDGTTQTLSSDEDLKALREACRPSGIRGRKGDHKDREEACFTLEFPVSVSFVDGSTLTFDDKESMRDSLRAYHRANPDADRPELVFPVTVTLEDGATQTLNSDEELRDLKEACRD